MTSPQPTSFSTMKIWKFFSKIKNKTSMPTLTGSSQLGTGSLSQSNCARKRT